MVHNHFAKEAKKGSRERSTAESIWTDNPIIVYFRRTILAHQILLVHSEKT